MQGGPHVVLAHLEGDPGRVAAVGDEQVHERVQRVLALVAGDLLDRLPLVLLQLRVEDARDEDVRGEARPIPSRGQLAADPRPGARVP